MASGRIETSGIPLAEVLEGDRAVLVERLRDITRHSPRTDRYRVIDEIAQGGMGTLLRIWDHDLDRELAMKRIATAEDARDSERHERMLARFIEEARITSRLDHPGIVPIHEIAVDGAGSIYFTMPLIRGRDLRGVLAEMRVGAGDWNLTRLLGVLLKVCEAVAFAHSRGIVHRDLKPDNVMVGRFGEAYVMDWGLARTIDDAAGGGVAGTPAYMSPEQAGAIDEEVGPLSDVYSLGAILYEILGGRMPHASTLDSPGTGATAILGKPPRSLAEVDPTLPPELVAICEKAMAARPEERYPGAIELADDLRAYLEGRVVRAFDASRLAHARKWMGRNRALVYALEALLLLAVVGGALFLLQERRNFTAFAREHARAQLENYAAGLRAVDLSLRVYETRDAKRRLRRADPRLRGWEWEHLLMRSDTSLSTVQAGSPVRQVALDPSGSLAAAGLDDGTVALWSPGREEGRPGRLRGHEGPVQGVGFVSGELLVSGAQDGALLLWDVARRSIRSILEERGEPIAALAVLPAQPGRAGLVASAHAGGSVRIWTLPDGKRLAETAVSERMLVALAFDTRGEVLFAVDAVGAVRALSARTGALLREGSVGHTAGAIAVHPVKDELAVSPIDDTIRILEAETFAGRAELRGHSGPVRALAFEASGKLLASGSYDDTVRLWESEDGGIRNVLVGHDDSVTSVAFLRSSGLVVSGSEDETLRLWPTDAAATTVLTGHEDVVHCVAYLDRGRLLSASRDGSVRAWDVAEGSSLWARDLGFLHELAVSRGSSRAAAILGSGKEIRVLDLESGEIARSLTGEADFSSVALDPEGTRLLARSTDETVRCFDVESGELLYTLGDHDWRTKALALSSDGQSLATGTADGRVRLYDAETGELLATLQAGSTHVTALAFDLAGSLLAAGTEDHRISLWEREGDDWFRLGSESGEPFSGHDNFIRSLAFHTSGDRLVSAAADGTLRVWHVPTGTLLLTLDEHKDAVLAVAIDPDGLEVASGSADHTVRIWRTRRPES